MNKIDNLREEYSKHFDELRKSVQNKVDEVLLEIDEDIKKSEAVDEMVADITYDHYKEITDLLFELDAIQPIDAIEKFAVKSARKSVNKIFSKITKPYDAIRILYESVDDSIVAFYVLHSSHYFSVVTKKELELFNICYGTNYTTIKDFLIQNHFANIDEWIEYVKNYAIDYQSYNSLKRQLQSSENE